MSAAATIPVPQSQQAARERSLGPILAEPTVARWALATLDLHLGSYLDETARQAGHAAMLPIQRPRALHSHRMADRMLAETALPAVYCEVARIPDATQRQDRRLDAELVLQLDVLLSLDAGLPAGDQADLLTDMAGVYTAAVRACLIHQMTARDDRIEEVRLRRSVGAPVQLTDRSMIGATQELTVEVSDLLNTDPPLDLAPDPPRDDVPADAGDAAQITAVDIDLDPRRPT